MKRGAKLFIILVLAFVIIGLSYYIKYKNDHTVIVEAPIEKKSIKIEEDRDYIYNLKNGNDFIVDGESNVEVMIPYINIYSSDASKVREEINKLYSDSKSSYYNGDLKYTKYTYYSSNVISLKIDYATTSEEKCLTYVFNEEGKLLTLREAAAILDIKDYRDKLNDLVKYYLSNVKNMEYMTANGLDYNSVYRANINRDNGFYVNEYGINVILDVIIGESVKTEIFIIS